MHSFYFLSTTY